MSALLLVGAGGHCRACIDVIESTSQYRIAGVVERDGVAALEKIAYPLLGSDDDLPQLLAQYPAALVTVGQIRSSAVRMRLFESLKALGAELPVVVSAHAYCAATASVGAGTIIMHGALVNAHAQIGENCIINSQALVEHDAVVESHCHVSTGARINGGVHVGAGSFIGSGAVVREGVRIGAGCIIGAGAIVLNDPPPGTTVRGIA
ncbi:acetyltransferase [Herbaspirillum chlorophenolicum]|uniref:Acetyltransferase n=1 Tax=Herbaspirillum chlorophenolicum TaxID=211589 RepID=A0ABW8ESD9_9BURK